MLEIEEIKKSKNGTVQVEFTNYKDAVSYLKKAVQENPEKISLEGNVVNVSEETYSKTVKAIKTVIELKGESGGLFNWLKG